YARSVPCARWFSLALLDRVAAELVAHSGEELARVGPAQTAVEAVIEREGDDRRGDVEVDGLVDRPASFARVLHEALNAGELGVLLECLRGQIEEPGADDGAVAPGLGDLVEVESELLPRAEDLESLGVRLHHPVLDPVVDHLDVVPRARGTHAAPALRLAGRECLQDGAQALDGLRLAADHHPVADRQTPDAAADADVDVVDTARLHQDRPALA